MKNDDSLGRPAVDVLQRKAQLDLIVQRGKQILWFLTGCVSGFAAGMLFSLYLITRGLS